MISTRPSSSSVAVWLCRTLPRSPVALKPPIAAVVEEPLNSASPAVSPISSETTSGEKRPIGTPIPITTRGLGEYHPARTWPPNDRTRRQRLASGSNTRATRPGNEPPPSTIGSRNGSPIWLDFG